MIDCMTIIGYWNGMAVCEDEWGNIAVSEIPEEFVTPGEAVRMEDCTMAADLPEPQKSSLFSWLHSHFMR